MTRPYLFAVLAAIVPLWLQAQSASITGTVIDEAGHPVVAADIAVMSAGGAKPVKTTVTDDRGGFSVFGLLGGRYTVIVSKPGVGSVQVRAYVVVAGSDHLRVTLRRLVALGTGSCPAESPPAAPADISALEQGAGPAAAQTRWIALVERHVPGCADEAVLEAGTWSRPILDAVVARIHRHSEFESRDRIGEARANARLKRGAVFHADAALFVADLQGAAPVLVRDGRHIGTARGSIHWEIGRQLLNAVSPSPREDADVRLWYRAVSAHLLRSGLLDEAPRHLERARALFPSEAAFYVDSAYLHERFGSPTIQNAVDDMRARQITTSVGESRSELRRAEAFLKLALALTPNDANARLRLGRIMGELGRHQDAVAELHAAMKLTTDRRLLYLAQLFLGREEHALGRLAQARRHFENAASLYPSSQTPWTALAHLARQRGDRVALDEAMRQSAAAAADSSGPGDPRWLYDEPHLESAPALIRQMRQIGREAAP